MNASCTHISCLSFLIFFYKIEILQRCYQLLVRRYSAVDQCLSSAALESFTFPWSNAHTHTHMHSILIVLKNVHCILLLNERIDRNEWWWMVWSLCRLEDDIGSDKIECLWVFFLSQLVVTHLSEALLNLLAHPDLPISDPAFINLFEFLVKHMNQFGNSGFLHQNSLRCEKLVFGFG